MNILYEDKYLIAVLKDAKKLTIATAKEKEKTLYHEVSEYVKSKNSKNKIFIIHRLDYETSGIVLFAKDQKTKELMQNNWNLVERNYMAIVSGIVKKEHDVIKSYLKETKTHLTYVTNDKSGKLAMTEYSMVKRWKHHSLVDIKLLTGRKNQIRVQFQLIGNPIVGDSKYGCEKNKYMLLHANRLAFLHPHFHTNVVIESKLPKYFNNID